MMEQEIDAGTVEGDGAAGAASKEEAEDKAAVLPEKSTDADGKATEEQEQDVALSDAAPADDTADAAAKAPPKRKSHRPSLEVVEVTVESFYDKEAFKQELQVRHDAIALVVLAYCRCCSLR